MRDNAKIRGNMNAAELNNFDEIPLADLPIAMAYVPRQTLGLVYGEEDALSAGTLFPELDKPFTGKRWGM